MQTLFESLNSFIQGMFGGISTIMTGIDGQPVLLAFVVLLPLMSIGVSLLMRFLGKRRSSKRR